MSPTLAESSAIAARTRASRCSMSGDWAAEFSGTSDARASAEAESVRVDLCEAVPSKCMVDSFPHHESLLAGLGTAGQASSGTRGLAAWLLRLVVKTRADDCDRV